MDGYGLDLLPDATVASNVTVKLGDWLGTVPWRGHRLRVRIVFFSHLNFLIFLFSPPPVA